jgi:hypothetical protein
MKNSEKIKHRREQLYLREFLAKQVQEKEQAK